jgi:hypothetical protein
MTDIKRGAMRPSSRERNFSREQHREGRAIGTSVPSNATRVAVPPDRWPYTALFQRFASNQRGGWLPMPRSK